MLTLCHRTILFGFLALGLSPAIMIAEEVSFSSDRWEFRGESRVEQHLGRESLYLKGGKALLRDVEFLDGVLEFDVAVTGERGFMGGLWRLQDAANYEEFYIRPHQSGNPDANQYTPVFNGASAWQLYHGEGYGAPVTYPSNEWIHVRIVVSGSRGEVYIDSDAPVVTIHEMKRRVEPGKVGVVCANFAGAHFSAFRFTTETPVLSAPPRAPQPTPPGTVTHYEVSSAFDGASLDGKIALQESDMPGLTWTAAESESTGLLNLARFQGISEKEDTVFARVRLRSDEDRVKKLLFGYSDRVRVWVNGRLAYGGTNFYRSRDYRYLGTIGLFDELYVPLREGINEIRFAVSESFGGWGIQSRFEDPDGISLEAGEVRANSVE